MPRSTIRLDAQALRDCIKLATISPSLLAVEAGISLSYLSELTSGTKENISPEKLQALANALRVAKTTLMAREELPA